MPATCVADTEASRGAACPAQSSTHNDCRAARVPSLVPFPFPRFAIVPRINLEIIMRARARGDLFEVLHTRPRLFRESEHVPSSRRVLHRPSRASKFVHARGYARADPLREHLRGAVTRRGPDRLNANVDSMTHDPTPANRRHMRSLITKRMVIRRGREKAVEGCGGKRKFTRLDEKRLNPARVSQMCIERILFDQAEKKYRVASRSRKRR